jgi:hypothetical protein
MRRRAPSMPPSRLSRSSKPRRDDDCRHSWVLGPLDVYSFYTGETMQLCVCVYSHEDGLFESSPGALGSTRSRWTSVTYIRIRFCLVVLKF